MEQPMFRGNVLPCKKYFPRQREKFDEEWRRLRGRSE
jgi:hypothetical protein